MWEFLAGLGVGNMLSDNDGNNGQEAKRLAHITGQIGILLAVMRAGRRLDNEIIRSHASERDKSYAYRAFLEVLKEVDADALPEKNRKVYDALYNDIENNITEQA